MNNRYGKPMKFSIVVVRCDDELYETHMDVSVQYGSKNNKDGFFIDDEFYPKPSFSFTAF